ncbi:hypothetical protein ACFSE0_12510 [Ochrobactrum teleogrylli]
MYYTARPQKALPYSSEAKWRCREYNFIRECLGLSYSELSKIVGLSAITLENNSHPYQPPALMTLERMRHALEQRQSVNKVSKRINEK